MLDAAINLSSTQASGQPENNPTAGLAFTP
jgi:hypothetical protein